MADVGILVSDHPVIHVGFNSVEQLAAVAPEFVTVAVEPEERRLLLADGAQLGHYPEVGEYNEQSFVWVDDPGSLLLLLAHLREQKQVHDG